MPKRASDDPPAHHRALYRHIASAWGSDPRVIVMSAKGTRHRQAIAVLDGHPRKGATAYATIGLSDHGGSELAAIASSRNESFMKAVFDVASHVGDGHRVARAGETFEKAIARYYTRCEAGHILLSEVPLPGLSLGEARIERRQIRWLHAWPVTADELALLEAKGFAAFEPQLARSRADVTDLDRDRLPGVPELHPFGG